MRKKTFILMLMALVLSSCLVYESVTFAESEAVEVNTEPAGDREELFLKVNEWLAMELQDPKCGVQHSDKEEGVIIARYLLHSIPTSNTGMYGTYEDIDVFAMVNIKVNDGNAQLTIKPADYRYPAMLPYRKEKAQEEMERLAESFRGRIR